MYIVKSKYGASSEMHIEPEKKSKFEKSSRKVQSRKSWILVLPALPLLALAEFTKKYKPEIVVFSTKEKSICGEKYSAPPLRSLDH